MHSNIESGRSEQAGIRTAASAQQVDATASTSPLADAASLSHGIEIAARHARMGVHDGRRMTAEREAQIWQRVQDGTYHSVGVVDALARRLLRSADL